MSTLKVNAISDAAGANGNAITLATDGTCTAKVTNNLSNRNLIINGSCIVAQRGNAASSALNGWSTTGSPDRFNMDSNLASLTGTQSQDTESPDGFTRSFKVNLTGNTGAMGATEYISIRHKIEAQDLQHLKNGTSGALSTTLSFWVRSPVTGAHCVRIRKEDNTAREITDTYTVSSANTWEHKSLTFPGDTAGGGIDNNEGTGFQISWCLGAGSNYTSTDSTSWINAVTAGQFYGHTATVTSQTGAFYLTGVQFEVGDYATDFEHKKYQDQLYNCQRYYQQVGTTTQDGQFCIGASHLTSAGDQTRVGYFGQNNLRTTPSITEFGDGLRVIGSGSNTPVTGISDINVTSGSAYLQFNAECTDIGDDNEIVVVTNTANGGIRISAEL